MRRWWIFFLSLTPLLLFGQTDWRGDLEEFQIEEGIVSYRDNGNGGKATIYKDYTAEASGRFTWSLGFMFRDLPTSNNRFELTLFSLSKGSYSYYYRVVPTSDFRSIGLVMDIYEKSSASDVRRLSRQYLTNFMVQSVFLFWSQLQMEIDYDEQKGIRASLFSSITGLQQSEWIKLREGFPRWQMSLETRFTAKKKLFYQYKLPTIVQSDDKKEQEEIHLINQEVEPIGLIKLNLTGPVSTHEAKVTCDGFQPIIQPGDNPRQVIIHLGVPFKSATRYDFKVVGLVDKWGNKVTLNFTVNIVSVDDGSVTIPEGIFITEVMAAPPTDGPLNGIKYIELFNNSGKPINLALLTLLYGKSKYEIPNMVLADKAFGVLYLESDPYPTRVATLVPMTRFPALSGSFKLSLIDTEDKVLDKVNFNSQIYGEGTTKMGASVERVAYQPDLWRRSINPSGGTPGLPTMMRPYDRVAPATVVINELLLSPPTTGEKFIELYNPTNEPINLANLYLAYSNKEESNTSTSWLLVRDDYLLQPHAYVVLCPFPEALERLYPVSDPTTFVERIDFPSISTTYSEVSLHAHATKEAIDRVVYRRQWLGDESHDRSGYSLERISPTHDGTLRSSWRRASANGIQKGSGATPGVANSNGTHAESAVEVMDWPDHPTLSYQSIEPMLNSFAPFATLTLYSVTGDLLMQVKEKDIYPTLLRLKQSELSFPSLLLVVDLQFHHPDKEPSTVSYRSVWAHNRQ